MKEAVRKNLRKNCVRPAQKRGTNNTHPFRGVVVRSFTHAGFGISGNGANGAEGKVDAAEFPARYARVQLDGGTIETPDRPQCQCWRGVPVERRLGTDEP